MWNNLTDRTLTTVEKVGLAKRLWLSLDQNVIRGRHVYLTQWASDTLTSLYNRQNKQDEDGGSVDCWQFLFDCLTSIKDSDKSQWVIFNPSFIKTLSVGIVHFDTSNIAYRCLETMLSWKPTPAAIMRYDIMLPLTVDVLHSNTFHSNLSTLKTLLAHICHLQNIHGNQKKIYNSVCQHLLIPLINLRSVTDNESILAAVTNIIIQLFASDHLVEYMSLLSFESHESQVTMATANYTRHLFETLKTVTPSTLMMSSLSFLFGILVEQNKSLNKLSCGQLFSFLLKLFQLLDLSVPMVTARKRKGKVTNNDTEKEQEEMAKMAEEMAEEMVFNKWEESIDTMNLLHTQSTEVEFDENVINSVHQCLLLVKQYGIYQIVEDVSNGGIQLYQLQYLTSLIVTKLSLDSIGCCFKCFEILLKLNHLIVEPLLPALWKLTFILSIDLLSDQNVNCIVSFFDTVITVYGKLHQISKVMEHILSAIKELLKFNGRLKLKPVLFSSTEEKLNSSLRDLQSSQCIELAQLLIKEFKETYLPLLAKLPRNTSTKKRRKRESINSYSIDINNDSGVILSLHLLVDLIGHLFLSFELDAFISGRYEATLKSLLNELINDVYLGVMEVSQEQVNLRSISLYLQLILSQICHSISVIDTVEEQWMTSLKLNWSHDQPLHPLIWKDEIETENDPLIDYLLRYLCCLELRYNSTIVSSDTVMEYLIMTTVSESSNHWNGQILNIDRSNFHTAIWSLIISNLFLLYRYISTSISILITDSFHTSLSFDGSHLSHVLQHLLKSDVYKEMKLLQLSLFDKTMQQLSSAFPKKFSKEMKKALQDTQSSAVIVLPEISKDGDPSESTLKKLNKFWTQLSSNLIVLETLQYRSHDRHMTKAVKGTTQLTVATLYALTNCATGFEYKDVAVKCCLVLGKLLREFVCLKKKEKKFRRKEVDVSNLSEILNWMKRVGIELDGNKEKQYWNVQSALLVAMEMLLQWYLLIELPVKPLVIKSVTEENEFLNDWKFILSHNISQYLKTNELSHIVNNYVSVDVPQLNAWVQPVHLVKQMIASDGILVSWTKLQNLLGFYCQTESFQNFLSIISHIGILHVKHVLVKNWVEEKAESMLLLYRAMIHIQSGTQCIFDSISDFSDVTGIGEHIFTFLVSNDSTIADKLCFCLCWKCIFNCSLSQENKVQLHRLMTKIVIQCSFIVTVTTSSTSCISKVDKLVIVCALQVLQILTSTPPQIGLDSRTLQLSMHGLAAVNLSLLSTNLEILKVSEELLLGIVQTHSHVIAKSPSPVLGSILKFLKGLIIISQQSYSSTELKLCTSTFVKTLEVLSKQEWFKKYAVHCVGQYVISIQEAPLKPILKQHIVSGILVLMKLLSPKDINLIKSSVNEESKSTLKDLTEQYNKFYRFKGKV